jgi:phosphonate degradation associated HDIG domain protein
MLTLDDITHLFARHGGAQYSGEPVTQLAHALQTAQLAEQNGASDELVTACLLHDLGHLLNEQGRGLHDTPSLRGIDDTHQYFALPFLRGLMPAAVLDAIRLHVDAKRYLCFADREYHAKLSDDSRRSLVLQGGVFDAGAAEAFLAQPGAHDAVRLRQWDDLAKLADRPTPSLAHYLERAGRCALRASAAPA